MECVRKKGICGFCRFSFFGDKRKDKANEKDIYREEIIEMIGKIEDERFLRNIYISLSDYLEENQNNQTGEKA